MKHRFCSQAFIRLTARNPVSQKIVNQETGFLCKIVALEPEIYPETRFLDAQVLLPSFQLASAKVVVDPIPRRVVALLGCR